MLPYSLPIGCHCRVLYQGFCFQNHPGGKQVYMGGKFQGTHQVFNFPEYFPNYFTLVPYSIEAIILKLKWVVCQLLLNSLWVVPLKESLNSLGTCPLLPHKYESCTALYMVNRKDKKENKCSRVHYFLSKFPSHVNYPLIKHKNTQWIWNTHTGNNLNKLSK